MYKTTNILHKGENYENFRNIINDSIFCHAVSAKNAEKACGGSRICEYWRDSFFLRDTDGKWF